MNIEDLPSHARELLDSAAVAHLGLLDDEGRPRVLPVTFVLHEGALWSAVDHKPKRVKGEQLARVRWLRARPEAALTVDVYHDDWTRLAWVQVLGDVEVLAASDAPSAVAALAAKYRQYAERPPSGPLLRLGLQRVLHWTAKQA